MFFELETGDIFSCYSPQFIPRFISLITFSLLAPKTLKYGPGHVATVVDYAGKKMWAESTTLTSHECVITGRKNPKGCQLHSPLTRITDYEEQNGSVHLYRLTPINSFRREERYTYSSIITDHFIDNAVDYDTGGALLSGTRIVSKLTRLLPSDAISSVFCSELIAACLMRVGAMNRTNPTRYNPSTLLRTLVRTGVYEYMGEVKNIHGTLTLVP